MYSKQQLHLYVCSVNTQGSHLAAYCDLGASLGGVILGQSKLWRVKTFAFECRWRTHACGHAYEASIVYSSVREAVYLCQLGLADADLREQELHSSHLIRHQISAITGSRDAIRCERPSEYSMEV